MTKKQLKEFVDQKRMVAINKANEDYKEELKATRVKLSKETKLDELMSEISKYGQYLDTLFGKWKEENSKRIPIKSDGYSTSIITMLDRIGCSTDKLTEYFFNHDLYGCKIPALTKLYDQHQVTISSINRTYDSIISNIVVLKNSKEVVTYLEELGFQVPEDENVGCTSLITPIDKKYLFLS